MATRIRPSPALPTWRPAKITRIDLTLLFLLLTLKSREVCAELLMPGLEARLLRLKTGMELGLLSHNEFDCLLNVHGAIVPLQKYRPAWVAARRGLIGASRTEMLFPISVLLPLPPFTSFPESGF
jgi:hypothetical protein